MRLRTLTLTLLGLSAFRPAFAQLETSIPTEAVNYKVLQDDPKDLNGVWLRVQPFTVDVMGMNAAVGSGLEGHWRTPWFGIELHGGIRGNFINAFDLQRTAALKGTGIMTQESKRENGSMILTNSFTRFYTMELGASYPILSKEIDGSSKIVVSESGTPGKTDFPEFIDVNSKVHQVIGVRLGFSAMASTVSLERAIEKQNLTLTGSAGTRLSNSGTFSPSGFQTSYNANALFTNFHTAGFYLGGSLQRIKNITIKTDRQGILGSNSIITYYADLILNPWTSLEQMKARKAVSGTEETFDLSGIGLNKVGGRLGFDIRYNQQSYLSFGAELGYRPAIQGQGWFGLVKLSIPTFSFGQKPGKVANNIGKNQSLSK